MTHEICFPRGDEPLGTLDLDWRDPYRMGLHHRDAAINELAATLERLAATQQNLPVPMTVQERLELRAAAKLLRRS